MFFLFTFWILGEVGGAESSRKRRFNASVLPNIMVFESPDGQPLYTKLPKVAEVFTAAFSEHPTHLWSIHDKYYDLKDFVGTHPGGEDFLMSCRGTDCTEVMSGYIPQDRR
jgi:cytochrome b involved in lipid metabolism